jgi:transposase-like protein
MTSFCKPSPKNQTNVTKNVIYKRIAPGSIIYSDCWKSYNKIKSLDRNFSHYTVNHDIHFVDPVTKVHTNSVESIWNSAKIHFKRMRGCKREYLQGYLDEFMFRRNNCTQRVDAFDSIINNIAEQYPPHTIIEDKDEELVVGFDDLCIDENDTEFSSVENDDEEDQNVQNLYEDLPLGNIEELELRQRHVDEEKVVDEENVVDEETWESKVTSMISDMIKVKKPLFIKFDSSLFLCLEFIFCKI